MRTRWLIISVLWPGMAMAQPVFFDDFDGPALAPHWNASSPGTWSYNFNNAMLNVTGLHYPSISHSSSNWAAVAANFAPQTDFRADVWMGWDAGQPWHRLTIFLLDAQFQGIASFTYSDETIFEPGSFIYAGASNQSLYAPAPPPGIHQFTVTRSGTEIQFWLNGGFFASFADIHGLSLSALGIEFRRSYPGEFAPLYVDRVLIVPSSGALAAGLLLIPFAARRSRR